MALLSPFSEVMEDEHELPPGSGPRGSRTDRLRNAFRGIKLGVRGHSSFFVHFFFAALVLAAGIVLHCNPVEWCLLLGCIAGVLITELFHSAVETIVQDLDTARNRISAAFDITAGAVLLARLAAALIGCIVLLSRLIEFVSWRSDL